MTVKATKALNTTAATQLQLCIGMPQEAGTITKAFEECCFHKHEMAFIYKEYSRQGKKFKSCT